jgi:hypothetical protein
MAYVKQCGGCTGLDCCPDDSKYWSVNSQDYIETIYYNTLSGSCLCDEYVGGDGVTYCDYSNEANASIELNFDPDNCWYSDANGTIMFRMWERGSGSAEDVAYQADEAEIQAVFGNREVHDGSVPWLDNHALWGALYVNADLANANIGTRLKRSSKDVLVLGTSFITIGTTYQNIKQLNYPEPVNGVGQFGNFNVDVNAPWYVSVSETQYAQGDSAGDIFVCPLRADGTSNAPTYRT